MARGRRCRGGGPAFGEGISGRLTTTGIVRRPGTYAQAFGRRSRPGGTGTVPSGDGPGDRGRRRPVGGPATAGGYRRGPGPGSGPHHGLHRGGAPLPWDQTRSGVGSPGNPDLRVGGRSGGAGRIGSGVVSAGRRGRLRHDTRRVTAPGRFRATERPCGTRRLGGTERPATASRLAAERPGAAPYPRRLGGM
ncbi:hypothetical protein EF879_04920 [Micromonospora sp. HM5-17]|nr:hypothetical protein EF879_04920 [Micromonospora sp. HM5-17]